MGLFNFFNNNKNEEQQSSSDLPKSEPGAPIIPERIFVENTAVPVAKPDESETVLIDNNINLLFNFLDRNHEAKGYDDAIINPDTSHLQQNIEALKNELERTINKVKTFYEDFINEIDFHIASRSRSGMIDIVEELEMKKNIAQSHMKKIVLIEESARTNTGDCKGIIISYTRGFNNGLAAISHHTILKRRF